MSSRRVYITLNPEKDKDRIIEAYLSQSYSEADAIKEAIFRLATNSIQQVQNDINNTDKVQLIPKDDKKVKKDAKRNGNKKEQKGADNTEKVEKIPKDDKVLNDAKNTEKVQKDNDDFGLDLSQFSDEVVNVNLDKNTDISSELKEKKKNLLQQFR